MSSATITTSARLMNSTPQTEEQAMVRKVAVSSFLGNFIEWFDYASYSYFATTIALVFFPTDNHTVAMLQTFGVFALSFILRPIGALSRIQLVSATAGFGSACFDCSLAISSSHTSLGVL